MDLARALSVHGELWRVRMARLSEWHAAVDAVERATERLGSLRATEEAALVRASGGLSARQRRWAVRHATYATRPRDRAGRRVLVTWTHRCHQIERVTARLAPRLEAAAAELAEAERERAAATTALLDTWGAHAAELTRRPARELVA